MDFSRKYLINKNVGSQYKTRWNWDLQHFSEMVLDNLYVETTEEPVKKINTKAKKGPCLWVPVTAAWGVLRLRMEERPPIWRVAANKLKKGTAAP